MTKAKRGNKDGRIFVRMPQTLLDAVEKKAVAEYLTLSEYVRKVLADAVRK